MNIASIFSEIFSKNRLLKKGLKKYLTNAAGSGTIQKSKARKRSRHQGVVAQLVRALPCHGRGYGFDSRQSRYVISLQC